MEVSGLTNRQLALVLAVQSSAHPASYLMQVEELADKFERYLNTGKMAR